MRYFCLFFLFFAPLALVGGCDGDDDGGGIVLAQGTKTIAASADEILAEVTVSEPGTLRGTITWSGTPTDMVGMFLHITPSDMLGITLSPSPTISTVTVTSSRVAAGHEWRFIGANPDSPDVSISYVITFTPD